MTDVPNLEFERAEELINQADETFAQAQYAGADTKYRAALALVESFQVASPERSEVLKARCQLGLGRLLIIQGRFKEALALVQPLPPILIMDPIRLAIVLMTLGEIAALMGLWDIAIQEIHYAYTLRVEWLGHSHPDTLDSLSLLALFHHIKGEKDPARDLLRKAVKSAEKYRADPPAEIGRIFERQGRILMEDPKTHPAAHASLKQALAIFEASEGPDHPDYGAALYHLSVLLTRASRWSEARVLLLRVLEIHGRVYIPINFDTAFALSKLSEVEQHLDHPQAAYQYAARALITMMRCRGAESGYTQTVLERVADLLDAEAQVGDENVQPFRACLRALETAPGAQLTREQAKEQLEQLVKHLEEEINHS